MIVLLVTIWQECTVWNHQGAQKACSTAFIFCVISNMRLVKKYIIYNKQCNIQISHHTFNNEQWEFQQGINETFRPSLPISPKLSTHTGLVALQTRNMKHWRWQIYVPCVTSDCWIRERTFLRHTCQRRTQTTRHSYWYWARHDTLLCAACLRTAFGSDAVSVSAACHPTL